MAKPQVLWTKTTPWGVVRRLPRDFFKANRRPIGQLLPQKMFLGISLDCTFKEILGGGISNVKQLEQKKMYNVKVRTEKNWWLKIAGADQNMMWNSQDWTKFTKGNTWDGTNLWRETVGTEQNLQCEISVTDQNLRHETVRMEQNLWRETARMEQNLWRETAGTE